VIVANASFFERLVVALGRTWCASMLGSGMVASLGIIGLT